VGVVEQVLKRLIEMMIREPVLLVALEFILQ
jgi:hypothetical protein